jgi:hypothetical protein
MPDVGLISSVEPLDAGYKVVIKYSIEVNGLAVYSETYDTSKLSQELQSDESKIQESCFRRLKCVIGCRDRRGFSACLTRCLLDGNAYDEGHKKRRTNEGKKPALTFNVYCPPEYPPDEKG